MNIDLTLPGPITAEFDLDDEVLQLPTVEAMAAEVARRLQRLLETEDVVGVGNVFRDAAGQELTAQVSVAISPSEQGADDSGFPSLEDWIAEHHPDLVDEYQAERAEHNG